MTVTLTDGGHSDFECLAASRSPSDDLTVPSPLHDRHCKLNDGACFFE